MGGLDEWLPPALLKSTAGTETGLQIAQVFEEANMSSKEAACEAATGESACPTKVSH